MNWNSYSELTGQFGVSLKSESEVRRPSHVPLFRRSIIGKEQAAEAGRPDMTPKKSQPDASNSSIGETVVGEMLIDQILGFAL